MPEEVKIKNGQTKCVWQDIKESETKQSLEFTCPCGNRIEARCGSRAIIVACDQCGSIYQASSTVRRMWQDVPFKIEGGEQVGLTPTVVLKQ